MKLLMITGLGSAKDLASEKKGAFYNTLEEFSKYWERIDIIVPQIRNSKSKIQNPKFKILFDNVYIHVSSWPLIFHPIWFLKKGLEIYQEQKFDLMTVQDYPPFYNGIGARLLWQKIKVPYVLEIHHVPGHPRAANKRERIYARKDLWELYWKIFGSKAKAIRVVNQNQTPDFLIKAGIPKEKIFYIPSIYIDSELFRPMGLQKEYDLIFVGRMESNKGADLFLETVKKLNCKAVMIGDGSLLNEIRFKIKNSDLDIYAPGRVDSSKEIAEFINKSRILVMPSYNEGGPRVVVEAMACGVPVLATKVGLIPDFADKNAVQMIDWNVDDIASKAKELLGNENEEKRLTTAGLEIAGQFEKKVMIKNYAEKLMEFIKT